MEALQHQWRSTWSKARAIGKVSNSLTKANRRANLVLTKVSQRASSLTRAKASPAARVLETAPKAPKLDSNVCACCGKYGHWQRDCLKKKSDQQNQQARDVEDVGDSKTDTTYRSATASTAAASVGMVSMANTSHVHGLVEDLTVFSLPSSSSSPFQSCMISSCDQFDMSSTDSDMNWTISPELTLLEICRSDDSICSCIHGHVRVVSNVAAHQSSMPCDVIHDSGADTSALPLRLSGMGTACPNPNIQRLLMLRVAL